MYNKFLFLIIAIVLLLASCNRKSNQVVTTNKQTVTNVVPEQEVPLEEVKADPAFYEAKDDLSKERLLPSHAAARKAQAEQRARIKATGEQEVIAELRRTSCYGECPVFKVQIMTDYTLRYKGIENVDLIGSFEGKLPYNPMVALSKLADQNGFYGMPSSYPERREDTPTDLPATITTIKWRWSENTVKHTIDGPKELQEIEEYFLKLVKEADWTEIIED